MVEETLFSVNTMSIVKEIATMNYWHFALSLQDSVVSSPQNSVSACTKAGYHLVDSPGRNELVCFERYDSWKAGWPLVAIGNNAAQDFEICPFTVDLQQINRTNVAVSG